MSGSIVSWKVHASVHNDRIPEEIPEKELSEDHHASGLILTMIEPMISSQTDKSADIDPGGFHIANSNHVNMSSFEIMLKISNKWVGFRRDYAPIHTQSHMTMLGSHLFRVK
jgi:hypothetical protein